MIPTSRCSVSGLWRNALPSPAREVFSSRSRLAFIQHVSAAVHDLRIDLQAGSESVTMHSKARASAYPSSRGRGAVAAWICGSAVGTDVRVRGSGPFWYAAASLLVPIAHARVCCHCAAWLMRWRLQNTPLLISSLRVAYAHLEALRRLHTCLKGKGIVSYQWTAVLTFRIAGPSSLARVAAASSRCQNQHSFRMPRTSLRRF